MDRVDGRRGYGEREEGSFHTLYLTIIEAFRSAQLKHETFRDLSTLLRKSFASLQNPLDFPGRTTADLSQVKKGSVTLRGVTSQLSQSMIELVERISEELDLNELECVQLLLDARDYVLRFQNDHYAAAIHLFFSERQRQLLSLLTLIQGVNDNRIPKHLSQLVYKTTRKLVKDGDLIKNSLKRISELNQKIQTSKHYEYFKIERRRLVECLFYASHFLQLGSNNVLLMLKELKAGVKLEQQQSQTSETQLESRKKTQGDEELSDILTILSLSIVCALDPYREAVDLNTDQIALNNYLIKDSTFRSEFNKKLYDAGSWADAKVKGIIHLAWTLCWQYLASEGASRQENEECARTSFENAISHGAFQFIVREMEEGSHFRNRTEKRELQFFIAVFSDLLCNIITYHGVVVTEMITNEEEFIREAFSGARNDEAPTFFEDLLLALAVIHKDIPELGGRFWNRAEQPELYYFVVKYCWEFIASLWTSLGRIHSSSFCNFLKFLRSISSNSETANITFNALKGSNFTTTSLDFFFEVLHQFPEECHIAQQQAAYDYEQSRFGIQGYSWFDQRSAYQPPAQRFTSEDLEAILRLIEHIALYSDEGRNLMLQEKKWSPVEALVNLSACSEVTPTLMGVISSALGAFGLVGEVASQIWDHLEQNQVVETIPIYPGGERARGGRIKHQLEEVEARSETYPETTGFLVLLQRLIQNGIPNDIGIAYRIPGFSPYLHFIQNDVFVKLDARRYKNPAEKWHIANVCLEIFSKILDDYVVDPQDFKEAKVQINGMDHSPFKPPGYEFMLSMLNAEHSPLLRKIFSIISTGADKVELARFSTDYGQAYEKCVSLCMQLLDNVLSKQEVFMHFWRSTYNQQGIVLTDLTKLIATDRQDVVVHIAKFIGYPHRALIRLHAARVLFVLSQTEKSLASIFASSGDEDLILGIFIDRLRGEGAQYLSADENENEDENLDDADEYSEFFIENKVRSVILDILLSNVDSPGHNLTHFLCGYNTVHKPAVIADSKKETCLQIVLSLLQSEAFTTNHPQLAEQCYELVYLLSADKRVSSPTLTYLYRIDFLCKQLQSKDKSLMTPKKLDGCVVSHLNQWAYLLKSVALEIFTSTSMDIHKHRGSIQAILEVLFSSNKFGEDEADFMYGSDALEQHRTQMLELLDAIDLSVTFTPERPKTALPISPEDCLETTHKNIPYYNIEALRSMLIQASKDEETRLSLYGSEPAREIRSVMSCAIQWNSFYQKYAALRNAFEGWKQVVEITMSQCYEMLESDTRERVLYEIMTSLLLKLSSGVLSKQLETSIAELILRLMTKLREQRLPMETKDRSIATRLPSEQCLTLLRTILRCILRDNTSISTRGNLYATLLNYLQYTQKLPVLNPQAIGNVAPQAKINYSVYLTARDSQDELARENKAILHSSGNQLIDKISKDAIAGNNVWRAVSFAALDILFSYDKDDKWLKFLTDSGVLQQFLDSLSGQEPKLRGLLNTETVTLNELYIYESKMSFFEKIALTAPGASALFRYGVVLRLKRFKFMDERPEDTLVMEDEWELPSIVERYHHLLLPLLRLLVGIFSSLRKNRSLADQILDFINGHHKVLSAILKDRQIATAIYGATDEEYDVDPRLTLEEVKLVSCLFNLLASHEDLLKQKLGSKVSRYRGQLVNVLVKCASSLARKTSAKPETRHPTMVSQKSPIDALIGDIRSNIIGFCKTSTDYPLDVSTPAQVLFTPRFTELQKDLRRVFAGSGQPPSLNVVAVILEGTMLEYRFSFEAKQSALANLGRIDELSPQMLWQLAQHEEVSTARVSARQQPKKSKNGLSMRGQEQAKLLAEINLSQSITNRSQELDMYSYIIENALVIIWRHLKHFLQAPDIMQDLDSFGEMGTLNLHLPEEDSEELRRDANRFLRQVLEELSDRELFSSELILDIAKKLSNLLSYD